VEVLISARRTFCWLLVAGHNLDLGIAWKKWGEDGVIAEPAWCLSPCPEPLFIAADTGQVLAEGFEASLLQLREKRKRRATTVDGEVEGSGTRRDSLQESRRCGVS
jgi:hypothetical protein